MINFTKNGKNKIYKVVQELKNFVKQNHGDERSSNRSKTSEQSKFPDRKYFGGAKKIEEDLDFFVNDNTKEPKEENMRQKK